ncbi:MAG: VanZ family protein [Armatimonadetes bacterium]|nr:VanZ family protein [Armatimonadota bacterium]
MKEKLRTWIGYALPPVIWLMVVLSFSSGSFSADTSGRFIERLLRCCWPSLLARLTPAELELLNVVVRKLAHVTEYALLAVLVLRAHAGLNGQRRPVGWVLALSIAAAVAVADETRQSFTSARTAAATDVLLDCGGAALGAVAFRCWERIHARGKYRRP